MSKEFNVAVGLVREHLESNCYSYDRMMSYLRCYRLLGAYLADKKELYSKPLAEQWLQSIAPGVLRCNVYRMALEKLDEAYHPREISSTNTKSNARQQRDQLDPWCKDVLDAFIEEISDGYASSYHSADGSTSPRISQGISSRVAKQAGTAFLHQNKRAYR